MRACLAEEFTTIYVLNLRGNQRTQGERSRREGGKIFGQGSRAPVAITVLVRNPDAAHDGCRILYRDVGDYLTREDKLAFLARAGSIAGIDDWLEIAPDSHNDWIGQRSEAFQTLYPLGSKDAKAGRTDEAVFMLFSNGYKTSRDAYIYNFSRDACAENARRMVRDYMDAMRELQEGERHDLTVEDVALRHSSHVRWDRELKNNLRRRRGSVFSPDNIWMTQYRPFIKQHCYVEYVLVNNKYRMDSIFPAADSRNRAICVPGVGSTKPFSVLIVDTMPDLELISKGQCFPRYRFGRRNDEQGELLDDAGGLERVDNVSDGALRALRVRYADNVIGKDDVFDYVYGVLHAPAYRERFANDLAKELPRVPFAEDFQAFARAGRALAALHLGYETCDEYPLETVFAGSGEPRPEHFRIAERAMRFTDDERTTLRVNEHVSLAGIPAEAHAYQVNGRTPLEWLIDRYRIVRNEESGIVNDPNAWFDDPRDLIAAIRRIVHVCVETVRIVAALPEPLAADDPACAASAFRAEAHRQSLLVAASPMEREDQAFVDAVTDWSDE